MTTGPNAVSCELDVGLPGVPTIAYCLVEPPTVPLANAICVTLSPSGSFTGRRGLPCAANAPEHTPTLRLGRSISLGPFRCTALRAGVRCTAALGRGFLLGAHGVKPVE